MKSLKENRKIWIIASAIVVVVIVILMAMLCGKINDEKEHGPNKTGQETVIDKDDSEDSSSIGLEVSDPEEADKAEAENNVEFIGPDGSNVDTGSDNDSTTSNGGGMGENNNTGDNNSTNNDEDSDDSVETGNLDEESDSNGKYGGFF